MHIIKLAAWWAMWRRGIDGEIKIHSDVIVLRSRLIATERPGPRFKTLVLRRRTAQEHGARSDH